MPGAPRRRGGARTDSHKSDRDGDLTMSSAASTLKNRDRVGKTKPPVKKGRPGAKGDLMSTNTQRAIIRKVAAEGDIPMKDPRGLRGALAELQITGWEKSKAANDKDGGVSSLIKWLEKKGSLRLGSRGKEIRVKKV